MDTTGLLGGPAVLVLLHRWLGDSVPGWARGPELLMLEVGFAVAGVVVFWVLGLYRPLTSVLNLWELRVAARGIAITAVLLLAGLYMARQSTIPGAAVVMGAVLSGVFVVSGRRAMSSVLGIGRRGSRLANRVLIVGAGEGARSVFKKITAARQAGTLVVGFIDDVEPLGASITFTRDQTSMRPVVRNVIGRTSEFEAIARRMAVDEILIDEQAVSSDGLASLIRQADGNGIRVGIVPALANQRADRFYAEDLSAIPVLRPRVRASSPVNRVVKRLMDLVGSALLILATAPVWLLAPILIYFDSPGPVFFRQTRIGQSGRPFRILKFRTMWKDVPPFQVSPTSAQDSRITRAGRLLRITGLDELPQLVNVLRGEMSLVGPRPEMPFIVGTYGELERRRLDARPGITGLWQLSPDRQAQIHENLEYDLYYLTHASPLLDFFILLETALQTTEIALRLISRAIGLTREPSEARPGINSTTESEDDSGRRRTSGRQDGLLVALDQRQSNGNGVPRSWSIGMAAACYASSLVPVRIMSSPSNRAKFETILAEVESRVGHRNGPIHITPMQGMEDLREHAKRAVLILTDYPAARQLAEDLDQDFLSFQSDDTLRAELRTELGRNLADLILAEFPPTAKGTENGAVGE